MAAVDRAAGALDAAQVFPTCAPRYLSPAVERRLLRLPRLQPPAVAHEWTHAAYPSPAHHTHPRPDYAGACRRPISEPWDRCPETIAFALRLTCSTLLGCSAAACGISRRLLEGPWVERVEVRRDGMNRRSDKSTARVHVIETTILLSMIEARDRSRSGRRNRPRMVLPNAPSRRILTRD